MTQTLYIYIQNAAANAFSVQARIVAILEDVGLPAAETSHQAQHDHQQAARKPANRNRPRQVFRALIGRRAGREAAAESFHHQVGCLVL